MTKDFKKLNEKDIAMVIATYDRAEEVDQTLSMIRKNSNIPGQIVVVDQSPNNKTRKVCQKHSKNLPIIYIYSKRPSSSISKNIGIKNSEKFKLILILDDDVDLLKGYLKEALKQFNSNPKIKGLGGADNSLISKKKKLDLITQLWFKIFFLHYKEKEGFRVIGPYGNTYTDNIKKVLNKVEWLPGFNMFYRREVFEDYKMPESIGYNILEDINSSYYVFKKYGPGSLIITPECKAVHRFSPIARYAEKKRIFVNHEDHFYFYYTYFYPKSKFKFVWSIFGIVLGLIGKVIVTPKRDNWLTLKYNIQAINYCIRHKAKIKTGKLRSFLNSDRSMKKEYE